MGMISVMPNSFYYGVQAKVVPIFNLKPSSWYIFSSQDAQHTVKLDISLSLHHVCAATASFRAIPLWRKTGSI